MYPETPPYRHGMLPVGDGNLIYWEEVGNPEGKPAVVVHGGPGSGAAPTWRRLFDPTRYRAVLFDQRNCLRSRPHASEPVIDLTSNTTQHLVADIELLREHLGIERWLVLGASWGSTLALAYAEAHTERVSEMVLFGVTTGQHKEFDWTFRGGLGLLFPEAWQKLREAVGGDDVVEACHRLLNDADASVRDRAAYEWCCWESAIAAWPPRPDQTLQPRFLDPAYRLAFARIVTHYVRHNAWLEDGALLHAAAMLRGIRATLINGRYDLQAVFGAWELSRVWPDARILIVDDSGHQPSQKLEEAVVGSLS